MNTVNVYVEPDSILLSKNGLINGIIALKMQNAYYPDNKWNDLLIVVLQWWLEACMTLLQGSKSAIFRFMDGPYSFRMDTITNEELYEITLLKDNLKITSLREVDGKVFFRSILSAANSALSICRLNDWKSQDIEELASVYAVVHRKLAAG